MDDFTLEQSLEIIRRHMIGMWTIRDLPAMAERVREASDLIQYQKNQIAHLEHQLSEREDAIKEQTRSIMRLSQDKVRLQGKLDKIFNLIEESESREMTFEQFREENY